MSDNQRPDRKGSPEAASAAANGAAGNKGPGSGSDEGAFLADLARAMQATVGAQRLRITQATDERQKAQIEAIRGREAAHGEELRESAERDVNGIEGWATAEIERIGQERERRTAARQTELEQSLEQHHAMIEREVAAVEAAVVAYRDEVDRFFARLDEESDPIAIAQAASHLPPFPTLEVIAADEAVNASSNGSRPHGAAAQAAVPTAAQDAKPAEESPSAKEAEAEDETEASPGPAVDSVDEVAGDTADEAATGEPVAESAAGQAPAAETAEAEAPGADVPEADAPAAAAAVAVPVDEVPKVGVMAKAGPVPVAADVTAWDAPAPNADAATGEEAEVPVATGAKITPRSSGAVIRSVPTHRPIGSWLRRSNNSE